MVTSEPTADEPQNEGYVRRLSRMAIRCGEDYRTVEIEIQLPIGSDALLIADAVSQSAAMGAALDVALDREVSELRALLAHEQAEVLVSPRQVAYIDDLCGRIGGDRADEVFSRFGFARDIALAALRRDQASALIDALIGAERALRQTPQPQAPAPSSAVPPDALWAV